MLLCPSVIFYSFLYKGFVSFFRGISRYFIVLVAAVNKIFFPKTFLTGTLWTYNTLLGHNNATDSFLLDLGIQ